MENRKIKILLIEDSVDDAELIRRRLEQSVSPRFQVITVNKLGDGLEEAARNAPDLILSDLGLPDSHGLDTVTKILLAVPHIPLVALSGFDDEDVAIRAVQAGAQDYLVKGRLENSQLERSIYYSIERSRLQVELEEYAQETLNVHANLHKILEKNADAIFVVGKDRRIMFINPAVESLLGRQQKELLKQPFDFPLDVDKTTEIEIEYADKEKTTAEMHVVEFDWEGSPAYLVSIHNITKRKKYEEALYTSEEKYRNIVELAQDGIITLDTRGQVISCNKAFLNMIGFSAEDVIGKNFTNLPSVTTAKNPEYVKLFASILSGKPIPPIEMVWKNRDGTPKISELRASLMKSNDKIIGIQALVIDITERKKAEETLRESEEKFSKAFHTSANLFAINKLKDGSFIEVNDSFTLMTGYTRAEVIGHNANDLNLLASEAEPDRIVKLNRANEIVRNEQIKIRHKSGEIHTGLFSSEQITIGGEPCIINTVTDITELTKAQQSLRVSEEKFSKAFHNSPEVIVISNMEDGTILEANDTFLRLTGYAREEVINKKSVEVGIWAVPEERAEAVKILKEKGIVSNKECRFRMKSGEIRLWLFSAEIINIDNKPCMLSVTTDITERKKMEDALREREKRFSDIAENTLEWIWEVDVNGKYTYSSPVVEKILGYTPKEILERHFYSFFFPEEQEELKKAALGVFAQQQPFHEFINRNIHKNGKTVDLLTSGVPIIDKDGNYLGYRGVDTDITDRKKMEDALRFSDAAFKSIHESVIATDTNHIVTRWNMMSEKIYGIKASRAIGRELGELMEIVENRPGDNERRFQRMETDGYLREEQMHRTKHGDVWVDVTAQAIEENGKRYGWVILASAITQRKLAEEALKRSEEKYRELINTSNDAIVSIDPQSRFILWNRSAEKMFGYTEKEMLGQSLLTIFPESAHQNVARELILLKTTGTSKTLNKAFETNILKKDCTLAPVDISISARKAEGGYICTAIMRDITERKEAEEKLRESEEKYRDLFENANDMIQSISLDGHFIYVNKAWHKALGYTEKEVEHLIIWDIIHPDHVEHCKEVFQKVTSYQTEFIETAFVAKNKKVLFVEGNANCYSQDGKITATRGIFRDVTERKMAEEKMRKIDQMKSEFLSNVSHELRTPLQSISGFTKLIMNGQVPDPATQQEFFQIIDRETMHLGNLINGLLDMSRLEAGRFQLFKKLFPIRETFIDSIKMFHSLARQKNITMSENIPPDIPEMEVDSERMREVVINLIGNAIKFSDPGGSVAVKVEKQANDLLFQVSDHGTGIREESMKHLFERFFRAEGETVRGGTGLGLYISKQIVDAHGGRIWAESKFGEGSTFSFTLPLNGKGGNGNGKENSGH